MPSVFFSYSHADEGLRDQLEKQLSMLKRQGVIDTWHDRRIGPGEDFGGVIDAHVDRDDIVLLMVSPDFLASDYCYEREMMRAMERHAHSSAIVIPVILRACDWHGAPFGRLQATPTDGRPVTQWPDRDQAFLEVALAVRKAAQRLTASPPPVRPPSSSIAAEAERAPSPVPTGGMAVRSSNLRVARRFNDLDRDRFKLDAFEFMALFFENSLAELSARNPGIEGRFCRIVGDRFSAAVYRDGRAVAQCTIYVGGGHHNGIAYSSTENARGTSFNEMLTVDADDHSLFLRGMGMSVIGRGGDAEAKLSFEGAAEHYWSMLVERLQHGG